MNYDRNSENVMNSPSGQLVDNTPLKRAKEMYKNCINRARSK